MPLGAAGTAITATADTHTTAAAAPWRLPPRVMVMVAAIITVQVTTATDDMACRRCCCRHDYRLCPFAATAAAKRHYNDRR